MRFSSCQEFRVSASITSFERLNDFRGPEIMIPELGAAGCGVEIGDCHQKSVLLLSEVCQILQRGVKNV